jgi:folate-binding protein YgfZ
MTGSLSDRAVISVSGPEAKSFLQGLITNDVQKLAPDAPLYAALLTPQGKILFDFLLSETEDTMFLDCAAHSADGLLKRLTMYRLRARVELARRSELAVLWNLAQGLDDPRWPALGKRLVGAPQGTDASTEYQTQRLALGIPEGADFGLDKMFALDAGLDELHAVSFEKGCYIGQELTARMKHRGTARKRLLCIVAENGSDLPPSGTEVRAGSIALGEITAAYGQRGFALVRLDRWEEAGSSEIYAGATVVRVIKPEWLLAAGGS